MTSVHIVQQTARTPQGGRPGLQAGSLVTARVLQSLGGGNYSVSLGGQVISVRSQVSLQPGRVFSAKIGLSGNQVLLSLVGNEKSAPLVTQFTSTSLEQGMSPQLSQLLASLGLPADAESFRLLQFAQGMGMKLEPRQLRKALTAAKAGGEETAQTALVMDEKGMNADAVQSVSDGMGSGCGGKGGQGRGGEKRKDSPDERQVQADARGLDGNEELAVAEEDALSLVRNYLSSVAEAAGKNKIGALTLFNSLRGEKKASCASDWIMLPFEWVNGYRGLIRILTEKEQKKLGEIIINAKNLHTSWNFVVYCRQGKIDRVCFSRFPLTGNGEELALELQKMLLPAFPSLKSVRYVAELDGWCAQDLPVGRVGGLV